VDAVGKFRALLGAGAVAAVLVAQPPAFAFTSSTTSTSPQSAPAVSTFVVGGAAATAQPFQLAPRDAGLAATVIVGQSIADYRDTLAQASSQTLNLGLIGSSLTVQCSALPAPLQPSQLPQPLSAESASGPSHAQLVTAGPNSTGLTAAAGRESVSALPQPNEAATADFDGGRLGLPGIVSLQGLSSHAHAELVTNTARVAQATTDIGSLDLLGGKIVLGGLHWGISLRSGAHTKVTRTFSLSSASIAGIKLPTLPNELGSTLATLNKALAKTGLHISLPRPTLAGGIYAITPLSIGIDNSALGKQLINPILNLIHAITDPALAAVTKAVCTLGSVYTTINLLLTGLNGSGALDVDLGGATATSDDTTYANPFGNGTPPTLPPGSTTPGGSETTAPGGGVGATPPPLPATSPVPQTNQSPDVAGTRVIASSCSTTSAAGRPGCSSGAGLAVGLIALATLGGVAAADFLVSRRRRRLATMAIDT
jgi:hypothetical protein